jgi:hypothetical protein
MSETRLKMRSKVQAPVSMFQFPLQDPEGNDGRNLGLYERNRQKNGD